jgi:hypothetical protein
MDVGYGDGTDPGVVELIIDEFVQLLAEAGGDSFTAAGVQISG